MEKQDWIKLNIQKGGNKTVIQFIADFLYHAEDKSDAVATLFTTGYCYYFAVILKEAFRRGAICQTWPFGHIVWVDEDGTAYDIYGTNPGEYVELVPVDRYGDTLNAFRHVPGERIPAPRIQRKTVDAIRDSCTLKPDGRRCYKD